MTSLAAPQSGLLRQYLVLTKPRVTQLAVFCAVIGMFLAAPGIPDMRRVLFGTIGIWLLAAAAFAINCLIEQEVDARMLRTARRATARGTISAFQVLSLSGLLGGAGMFVLYNMVNPLTMWLTFATFVGYAIIYTIILKPRTPQNIVIGGLSGAMPPALGWAAVADSVPAEAWVLVLIIFIWTPPHFWALAIFRREDYAKAEIPMLPVTHGVVHTRKQIMVYSVVLALVCLLPYLVGMSGAFYLGGAIVLNAVFLWYAWRMLDPPDELFSMKMFYYSIVYLMALFAFLLVDHWILPWL